MGEIYFYDGDRQLELWEEFSQCVRMDREDPQNDRAWLVESGERVVFNGMPFQEEIPYSKIIEFTDWLNETRNTSWPDRKTVTAQGRVVFCSPLDHDVVALVRFRDDAFQAIVREFSS